jgi:hypothetical protein
MLPVAFSHKARNKPVGRHRIIAGSIKIEFRKEEVAPARHRLAGLITSWCLTPRPMRFPGAAFSKIVVPYQYERILRYLARELDRLLAPGGEIIHKVASVS